jgi:hypothetical protein
MLGVGPGGRPFSTCLHSTWAFSAKPTQMQNVLKTQFVFGILGILRKFQTAVPVPPKVLRIRPNP